MAAEGGTTTRFSGSFLERVHPHQGDSRLIWCAAILTTERRTLEEEAWTFV